ncbi:MAG: putative DNA binding domain-containing protein [Planctomycetes bacterium]|nr:putative DNA binding domain-containing protein [Planctomycetota bacterium]
MIEAGKLRQILREAEADRVEKTQSVADTDKFCQAICAFANDLPDHHLPGYLVIGVNVSGEPTGTPITEQLLVTLAAHRDNGQIIPQPMMHVVRLEIDGNAVAVIEVLPSTLPPVRYKGVTYIRTGPRRGIATQEEERRLSERRVDRARTWDARNCPDGTLDDLSLDLFKLTYLPNAVSRQVLAENERTTKDQLAALRFWDSRNDRPTNAAILLFGKDCLNFFPGAYIQYVSYDGQSQASEVLGESRITGDLLSVMRELDQLAIRLAEARPSRQEDLTDTTVYAYPPAALHELLINAVIHRNYEDSTTPIMVNQFNARLEIHNPGSLFGDLTRDHFPGGTAYRNPIVAEAAKTLGFVNRFGRGIAIAENEMKRNGNPRLEFDIGDNHLAAILRARA